MKKASQAGAINVLLIPLTLAVLLLIGALAFGYWAFGGRQDYKNNVDQKVAAAVDTAKQQVSTQKDKEFAQKEKYPYDTYDGPSAYGSLIIKYPKTWSAYVNEQQGSSTPVDGYFYPNFVPSTTSQTNNFALRVRIVQQTFSSIVQQIQPYILQKQATYKTYRSPNVPNVIGARIDGAIMPQKQGSMIVLPMRDKSLEIWTESKDFQGDFNSIILPNFSFSP